MDLETEIQVELEKQDDKEYDAQISRCYGLLELCALRKTDNATVFASDVTKADGPFYCPVCLSDAIVRKCTEKVDHFAHHARQSPIIRKRDKELHNKCRDQIFEQLKATFPNGNWATEREIPDEKQKGYKKVIPDISGRINNIPIVIEVQASAYTLNRIFEKVSEYQKRNTKPRISVLYIIPLFEELGDEPLRPRLFEKFLHSMYYGRVYYWSENLGHTIQPVHYSPAKRWIEPRTWFDTENGEERTEGGFFLTYRTIKKPLYSEAIDITKDFISSFQKGFQPKNVKKTIPPCTLYMDKIKPWWDKDERKNIDKQFDIFKNLPRPDFIDNYEYFDDYDDENWNE